MQNRISCLVAEPEPEAMRQIDVLGRQIGVIEVRWKSRSLDAGIELIRKHRPELAIVGLDPDPGAAIARIAELTAEFPSLCIVALSARSDADLILCAMRAGVHDFLRKPATEADLRAAVDKVLKRKSARTEPQRGEGRVVTVFSNKGGNGGTTIAVNLADAVARDHGKKTVVVDLAFAHGDVATFFNVTPAYSILDLAKNAEKADHEFLHSLLVHHGGGVYILADPPSIEEAERISPAQVRDVIVALRSMFDFVVVDTPHQFDERTLTALEMSDVVILVSLLNLPSLRNTQRCLELFGRIGLGDDRIRLVLSRYLPDDEISKESVEKTLQRPVFFTVPNDYPSVIASVNRGRPLREVAPDKEITRSFRQLAALLLGARPASGKAVAPKKPGFLEKVFPAGRSRK